MRRAFFALIERLAAAGTTVLLTTHFLDEAEYCHRVVLISRGRILADASPAALKEAAASAVLVEVRTDRPGDALRALAGAPGFREAALFGAGVHARAEEGVPAGRAVAAAAAALASAGVAGTTPVAVPPTLEDVFLDLVRREEGGS
jgi:ABC-2 type transport system ATP-binding protein